eukprot:gb/GEZJ01004583.1/.p1 GENE.gb/GEZJ01004583.1/~~gb/GEZJ01004583.1/.p1  ORF type:complete len:477 (+),score=67.41 gb/GEZJ01004583.1/:331-1761(+)
MKSQPVFVSSFLGTVFDINVTKNDSKVICMSSSLKQAPNPKPRRSVVWFREGDLRVEHHPGLQAAISQTPEALAPLLVCTPKTSLRTLQAAKRMQRELNEIGSHLVVRFADDEAKGVIEFVKQYQADNVYVHMDVEHEARAVVREVANETNELAEIRTWNSSLLEWGELTADLLKDMPDEYPKFLKWKKRPNTSKSDGLPKAQNLHRLLGPEQKECLLHAVTKKVVETRDINEERKNFDSRFEKDQLHVKAIKSEPDSDGYGEGVVRRFLETSDAYEVSDPGRSIAEVLHQGALPHNRICEIVHEHERRNGRLWRPIYREGAKQVLRLLEAKEFATMLARRDVSLGYTVDGEHEAKFWKWRGYLVRYIDEGKEHSLRGKPPLLLIHGFGASSQHYKRSIRELKNHYHVYALDLVGFGRSEKPPTQYTQAFWECVIWDFVEKVVQQPVFVAGNSIGVVISHALLEQMHFNLTAEGFV